LVERDLAKVEVAGSKPVSRSSFSLAALDFAVAGDGLPPYLNVARGIDRARGAPASVSLRSTSLSRETGAPNLKVARGINRARGAPPYSSPNRTR
jgi:hypothetical protein